MSDAQKHIFSISYEVALSGADWKSEPVTVEVRAWSLAEAFLEAAKIPFPSLMGMECKCGHAHNAWNAYLCDVAGCECENHT